jgi:hypothetical protein
MFDAGTSANASRLSMFVQTASRIVLTGEPITQCETCMSPRCVVTAEGNDGLWKIFDF